MREIIVFACRIIRGFNEIINVKHLTVLTIQNSSITAELYYFNCELGIVYLTFLLHRVVNGKRYKCNHYKKPN